MTDLIKTRTDEDILNITSSSDALKKAINESHNLSNQDRDYYANLINDQSAMILKMITIKHHVIMINHLEYTINDQKIRLRHNRDVLSDHRDRMGEMIKDHDSVKHGVIKIDHDSMESHLESIGKLIENNRGIK